MMVTNIKASTPSRWGFEMVIPVSVKNNNMISYFVFCDEVSKTSKGKHIIISPFTKKSAALPYLMICSIAIGVYVDNKNLKELYLSIDHSGEEIANVDLKELYFESEEFFDDDGERTDAIVEVEILLSNDIGLKIEKHGMYVAQIICNEVKIGSTFFYIEEPDE